VDFLDKIFEKLPYEKIIPIPTIQRVGGLAFIIVVGVVIFYMFPIASLEELINQKNQELSKIQKEVDALKSFAMKQDKLERQVAKLEAELSEAKKILPSEREIPNLLEQISNFGLQAGLKFEKFVPKGEVQKEEYYSEVPVDIEVQGKFHNVLMFFDEIAHLPRIVTVGNVSMMAGKEKDASTLSVKLMAVTYRFIESAIGGKPPVAAPAGDDKGKKS